MLVNLVKIEEDILAIHEKCVDANKGQEWIELARYIGIQILESRVAQENECTPVSVIQLELAGLEGKDGSDDSTPKS